MVDLIVQSFGFICGLVAVGSIIRGRFRILYKLHLPVSVVAGFLGLIVLQTADAIDDGVLDEWTSGWGDLAGFLINIVFAALFLGEEIAPVKEIWRLAGPQLCYSMIVNFGQYGLGLLLTLIFFRPVFDTNKLFGLVMPIGFEGGHGTAAALGDTMDKYDFPEGEDLGLAAATVGLMGGVVIGMVLINMAYKYDWLRDGEDKSAAASSAPESQPLLATSADHPPSLEAPFLIPPESRTSAGKHTVDNEAIDSLSFHLGIIGIAVGLGYGFQQAFISLEELSADMKEYGFLSGFPLFPFSMAAGILIQIYLPKVVGFDPCDHNLMNRLSGLALDFLVTGAIASMNVSAVWDNIVPFLILMVAGISWQLFCFFFLARRLLPNYWFEQAIANFGQEMGVTATGLLLLRTADPHKQTPMVKAFAYKQILFEPLMGGGLWTSAAIPVAGTAGTEVLLGMCAFGMVATYALWYRSIRPLMPRRATD